MIEPGNIQIEENLARLNPLGEQEQLEQEPTPQIIPTSEHTFNEFEPEPTPIASPNEVPIEPDFWDSVAVPRLNNYVPRETYLPDTNPEGSVVMANLERDNTIVSWANQRSARNLTDVDYNNFFYLEHLTPEQLPDAEYYAFDMNQDQIDETNTQLQRERKNDALIAAHPWQSLGLSVVLSPLEISNYLPFGVIYNKAMKTGSIARAAIGASVANVGSTIASEAALHNSQLTRTVEESIWNVAASAVLGGALGAGAARLGPAYRLKKSSEVQANKAVVDIYTDAPEQSVGAARVKELDDSLANLPEIVKMSMFASPGARLASSDYKSAQRFNQLILEPSLYTKANEEGLTRGVALETYIKKRKGMPRKYMLEYQDAYFAEIGITSGPFKKTRAFVTERGNPTMSSATFAQRVSYGVFMNIDDPNPNVQKGIQAIRASLEEDARPLREMGLLPEEAGTATSAGYLTIIPNKQKILEQGGRNARGPGTYPQALFDGFKRTQEEIKAFKQDPLYLETKFEIEELEQQLKGTTKANLNKFKNQVTLAKKERTTNKQLLDYEDEAFKRRNVINSNFVRGMLNHWNGFTKDFQDKLDHTVKVISEFDDYNKKLAKQIDDLSAKQRLTKDSKEYGKLEVQIDKMRQVLDDSILHNKINKHSVDNNIEVLLNFREISNKLKNKPFDFIEARSIDEQLESLKDLSTEDIRKFIFAYDENPFFKKYDFVTPEMKKSLLDYLDRVDFLDKEIIKLKEELDLKVLDAEKIYESWKKPLSKEEKVNLQESIDNLNDSIKRMTKPTWLNSEGKLWDIVDDDALWSAAINVVDKQLSMEGDTLLNPILRSLGNPDSLKSRTLMIPQEDLHPWHIQDPVKIALLHNRALAPYTSMEMFARDHGFENFNAMREDFSNQLKAEFDEKSLIKSVKPSENPDYFKTKTFPKMGIEIAKLEKEFRSVQNDMKSTLEILQGIYGEGENTITSTKPAKFFQWFRDYNYLRMMGSITLQSFNDIGSVAIRNGVFNTMYHGLLPMLSDMKHVSKKDLKAINYGMESELGLISQRYMDQEPLSTNPGIWTKSVDVLKSAFGDLTLFNQWNGAMQRLSMNVSINNSLDTIHKIVKGEKVTKKARTRLAALGIQEQYFPYIVSKTSGAGNISKNGTRVADWTTWNPTNSFEANALRDFQAATIKDIDQTVIAVGAGDKPLWTHSSTGKTITQFKGFGFASTNKTTYSAIQRRHDAEVYTGMTLMLTLGAMSYAATQYTRGKEPDFSLGNLALESIDRSGIMGIMMEGFDISKSLGIIPGAGVTRYNSRGPVGALMGPTFGTVDDMVKLLTKVTGAAWGNNELTTNDMNKMLKLLPLSNLAYLNWLDEQLVTRIGDEYNLTETRAGY